MVATTLFVVALLHSFSTGFVSRLSKIFSEKNIFHHLLHWLSEVEIVFGFWALTFLLYLGISEGPAQVFQFHSSLNITEAFFIFCIMLVASTRAIVTLARRGIYFVSALIERFVRIPKLHAQFFGLMTLGPLLGSIITEPAAITIAALLLFRMIDIEKTPQGFVYVILAFLFVNVSVGGALTPYAAPPILMVARPWAWGLKEVFINLGIPGLISILISNSILLFHYRKKLIDYLIPLEPDHYPVPHWVTAFHSIILLCIIYFAHSVQVFVPLTFLFIAFTQLTKPYQDGLKYKESLLVAFFLYGLIVFGSLQSWWLNGLIAGMSSQSLFFGAITLTAVTDNAALTYLGSQIENLSEISKWSLTAGALVGGGLTILANAPNAAGFAILSSKFEGHTLNAWKLFKAALLPTGVALLCYYIRLMI